ncbi:MAG: prenyltransferase/squalene oxidase repeat-containing protein [Planctomycetaceae bacterium]
MLHTVPERASIPRDRLSRRAVLACLGAACLGRGLAADESPSVDSRDLLTPESDAAISLGLDWLAGRQQPDGAFGPEMAFNRYRRNPAVNAICGLALLASGSTPGRGPYGLHLDRLTKLLHSYSSATGFISEPEADYDQQPMYGHGFAATYLAEVYGMSDEPQLRAAVHRAVQLIVDTQNREGGWRYHPEPREADISVTVCQVMALRAAHNTGIAVPRETIDRAVAYVTRCQNPDGGFRYQPLAGGESAFPRSAAALVALFTSGAADSPAIASGLRYLQQFRPGEARGLDRGYYFYAQYYAVQAAWHAGGDHWREWYSPLRDELLRQQLSDGHWNDPVISAEYATAMALIALQLPNNYLPIFQR